MFNRFSTASVNSGTERRRAREDVLEVREFVVVDQRVLAERDHDRRHDVRARNRPGRQHFQERLELELRHRHDGRAAHQAVHHDDDHAVDVEERQHAEQRRHLDALDGVDLLQLRDDAAVHQHDALRQPGGA